MEKVEEDLARSKNLREKQAKEFSRQLDDLKIKHEKEVHFFVCQFCSQVMKNIHRVSLPWTLKDKHVVIIRIAVVFSRQVDKR